MKKKVVFPSKIIYEKNVYKASNLLIKKPLQIGINEKKLTALTQGSSIILDFGMEYRGSLRVLTFVNNNCNLRIRYGESVNETCSEIGQKNSTNDHSVRDFTVTPPHYSDQIYINSGFRFVRLDALSGEIDIKCVVIEAEEFDQKPIYEYTGKDELIKEIFNVAKRTVSLCATSDYIWDGIKRDRLVWYGDLNPETIALATVYGRVKQIENSINYARVEYKLPQWLNNFPSYSMWWICCVCDYYELTKNISFTKKQLNYLSKLIDQMNEFVKEDGELNYPFYFTDWPTYETDAAKEGVRAINIIAVKKAIKLLDEFNYNTDSAKLLLDKLNKKQVNTFGKKQIIALNCLAKDKVEKEEYEKLIENGSQGFSTFMSYYILKAIAMYNKDKAIELMKEYFGKMIELGATTFWEDFDINWANNSCKIDEFVKQGQTDIHGDFGNYCYQGFRHSFCHGWSSGIIKIIKDYCE